MRELSRVSLVVVTVALALATAVSAPASEARSGGHVGTIAFLRHRDAWGSDPRAGLFVIRADGSGLRRVTSARTSVWTYRWSPDGRLLAYIDKSGSLWLVRPDGTGHRRLVDGRRLRSSNAEWAPDGKSIAVFAEQSSLKAIYLVTLSGRELRLVAAGDVGDPVWSPLGDRIAYSTGAGAVSTIRPDGTDVKQLFGGRGGLWEPHWSADGRRLAFASGEPGARYGFIYVSNADGSNLRPLTRRAYNEYGFEWSPDGQTILYGRENSGGIHTISFDSRNDFKLTRDSPPRTAWGTLSWSPDGRSIAYITDQTGRGDLYVVSANGRNKLQLTQSPHVDISPAWAPR